MSENITSIYIMRLEDMCILCEYTSRTTTMEKKMFEKEMKERLSRVSIPPLQRQKHIWKNGCFFVQANVTAALVYVLALKDIHYPERWSFAAIQEVMKEFESKVNDEKIRKAKGNDFSSLMRKDLREIVTRYRDLETVDKVRHVNDKVENCKEVMKGNIKDMLENRGDLEVLESKATTLHTSAKSFQQTTKKAENSFLLSKWKWTILAALVSLALIGYLIYIIVVFSTPSAAPK